MSDHRSQAIVPVALNGGRVTRGFREALFTAANRAGMSVNEFVLRAAGQQLVTSGFDFDGVFASGDLTDGTMAPTPTITTSSPKEP